MQGSFDDDALSRHNIVRLLLKLVWWVFFIFVLIPLYWRILMMFEINITPFPNLNGVIVTSPFVLLYFSGRKLWRWFFSKRKIDFFASLQVLSILLALVAIMFGLILGGGMVLTYILGWLFYLP